MNEQDEIEPRFLEIQKEITKRAVAINGLIRMLLGRLVPCWFLHKTHSETHNQVSRIAVVQHFLIAILFRGPSKPKLS